jgi:Ca2+-binding RTX toxin-like protein
MIITYLGGNSDFFSDAFFDTSGEFDANFLSASSTRVVLQQPTTRDVTTITGTDFTFAGNDPTGGTVTGMSFSSNGVTTGTITGISWSVTALGDALDAAENDNPLPLGVLFSSSGGITVDASGASSGFEADDLSFLSDYITVPITINGSRFDDELSGGRGNDTIRPGANDGYDKIEGSLGNDVIDFAGANSNSYYSIDLEGADLGAATFNLNGTANTGSFTASGANTTLQNVRGALTGEEGGLELIGTGYNDVFNIASVAGGWLQLTGGLGNDTFNLTLDGTIRLAFNWNGDMGATQGVVVNLATGVIANDGFGGRDTVNVLADHGGRLEVRGTQYADRITGSARDERFITESGNDTVDGGGGADMAHYDRNGLGAMNIDLAAGTASGTWYGQAFTDTLIRIEDIRGTGGDDTIRGNGEDNRLEGRDGNDLLEGRAGDDDLRGGDGSDTLVGGNGDDSMDGGAGDDDWIRFGVATGDITVIDLGDGRVEIQSSEGTDTVQGGEWFEFSDDTLTLSELLAIDNDGSGGPGLLVPGTPQHDTLTGTDGDDTVNGGAGNDTMDGGAGNDMMNGGIGFDSMEGGNGDDTLIGLNGFDTLSGGGGDDSLNGGFGNDMLEGGAGNDTLNGGLGIDIMDGGSGDDVLIGLDGNDIMTGGSGNDTLSGNAGFDSVSGGDGDDVISGGLANDTLSGGDGDDIIGGDNGFDLLFGGDGNDDLHGNSGNDTLNGGAGDDTMRGGQGADVFVFTGGNDLIRDFSGIVDSLEIDASLLSQANPQPLHLAQYDSIVNGNLVLDFGDGNTLTFNGIGSVAVLFDDVTFI